MWENLGTIGVLSRHDLNSLYSFIQLQKIKYERKFIQSKYNIIHFLLYPLLSTYYYHCLLDGLSKFLLLVLMQQKIFWVSRPENFYESPGSTMSSKEWKTKKGGNERNKLEILFFYLDRHEGHEGFLYCLIFVESLFFHCLLCRGHPTVHLFLLALRKGNNAFVLSSEVFQLVYLECRRQLIYIFFTCQ